LPVIIGIISGARNASSTDTAGSLTGIAQTAIPADVERATPASVQATANAPK
jgi:hypothetical protein